jgi:hypothetical protein
MRKGRVTNLYFNSTKWNTLREVDEYVPTDEERRRAVAALENWLDGKRPEGIGMPVLSLINKDSWRPVDLPRMPTGELMPYGEQLNFRGHLIQRYYEIGLQELYSAHYIHDECCDRWQGFTLTEGAREFVREI